MDMNTMSILALILGWLTHHISVISEMSSHAGKIITPFGYIKLRPYKFISSVIGTALGFMVMSIQFQGLLALDNKDVELMYLLCMFGAGYMPDNIIDKAGKFSKKKMDDIK